jgi:FlaA1/EpsC-like NDP-sugar epimerase
MIQRIQSVWLLLASAAAFLTIRFSSYSGTINNLPYQQLNAYTGGVLILIVTIIIGVTSALTIFLFKSRQTQIRLCLAAFIAELLLLVLYFTKIKQFSEGTLSLSSLLHAGILVFLLLALKGIHQDERLVKESNKLR